MSLIIRSVTLQRDTDLDLQLETPRLFLTNLKT